MLEWYHGYSTIAIVFFIVLPIIMLPLTYFLTINNRKFISKYKSTKFFAYMMFPIVHLLSGIYFMQAFDLSPFVLPLWVKFLIELNAYLVAITMGIFTIILIKFFGSNWLLRRKYFWRDDYGPYLIMSRNPQNSIKVCGHISRKKRRLLKDSEELKKIYYHPENSNDIKSVVIDFREKGFWHAKLDGLNPETDYYYKCLIVSQNEFHFKTAPKCKDQKDQNEIDSMIFRFIHVSDLHGSGHDMSWILKVIKERYSDIPFIISSGDTVSDGRNLTHWRTFFNQLQSVGPELPYITCTGNHDCLMTKMAKIWKIALPYDFIDTNNSLLHYFSYNNACFIFLDNYNAGTSDPIPNEKQLDQLREILGSLNPDIHIKFLICHEAFYSTSTRGFRPEIEAKLLPIIKEYRINSVLTGHSHYFELFNRDDLKDSNNKPLNTSFFIAGGSGGRIEKAMFRKFINNPPYYWEGPIHNAQKQFFSKGNHKSKLRNDEIVRKYQRMGFSKYHFMVVSIFRNKINFEVIGKKGQSLFTFEQAIE